MNVVQVNPLVLTVSENPMSLASMAEEKYRTFLEKEYWKMNSGQK